MNHYLFYTDEGETISPTELYVENCQLLGTAEAKTPGEALAVLLQENKWIIEYGFNSEEIKWYQLA